MSLIHNEQTKLLATGLNTIAAAFIIIDVVTPVTAVSFGIANAPKPTGVTVFFAAVWLCTGFGIHWIARRVLRSLKP
ncbi:hypothetical protein [Methylobacterium sp. WL120]|uniref:hypothetical protein n=1 Tax=Methylobacterium sp. WL120 TaxID=2603887 RepID=UPI0011CBA406|nr:hypothetical protein [Methylobacterium sp. WL120]TXM63882.1 hypothetical protein FV229_20770 [Methylobacterium sp. WL120]